jgi:succinate dehydrogenase/fumarate reductase flavoprotein subunit
MRDEYIRTDVLVIGGGLAGCFAAIKAAELGAEVVIFDKANIRRSGNGGAGLHRIPLIHPNYNITSQEFAGLSIRRAAGICDEDVSYEFARDTFDRVLDLESFGIPMRREDGSFIFKPAQDIAPGKIAIQGPGPTAWRDIKPILARKAREAGAKVFNRTAGIGLLTEGGQLGGRVIGAVGLGTRTGKFIICAAKAVVLTTGGSYRVGRHKNSLYAPTRFIECGCPTNSGDGQHMAYRAGADIVNLEFLELSLSWKDLPHRDCGPIGVVGRESLGTDEPVSPSHEEASKFDRYVKTYFGLDAEILFNNASAIPVHPAEKGETLELLWAEENEATSYAHLLWQKERGKDFKGPIEFEWRPPYLHNNQAGIHMNTHAGSSLGGLYCAGDVIGGGWRQSAGGAFVFGARAGRSAAEYALQTSHAQVSHHQVDAEKNRLLQATDVPLSQGYSWIELEDKARQIVSEYGGPLTTNAKLQRGLTHLERIKTRYLPFLYARNARELLRVSEVHSTFWIAEAHLRAALFRQESRFPYASLLYKRGCPLEDDQNWLKHSVIRNIDWQMTIGTKEVKRLE